MNPRDPMQPCEKARASLGDYLEGLLDAAALDNFEAHLDGCRGCRAALAAEREFFAALGSLESERAPRGFDTRVMAALFPSPASWRYVRDAESQPSIWSRFSLAGAILMLMLIMGQWFVPGPAGTSGPERLRDSAAVALLEGGRDLSDGVQIAERARARVEQITMPTVEKTRSVLRSASVIVNTVPAGFLLLIVLVGLAPLVLVFTVFRLRSKGVLGNVLVLARPH